MTKKKEEYDAAGGVTPTASPGRKKVSRPNKVMYIYYCEECKFHLIQTKTNRNCKDCKKEMKEIGNVEYANED